MQRRYSILHFTLAMAAFAACSELPTGSKVTEAVNPTRVVSAQLESMASSMPSGKRLTPYYCSIVSLAKDGRYKKATLWLKFPESLRSPNGTTQPMRFEWRVGEGSPLSGAFCRIPNTPQAVDHLLSKVLFIDPKTMKGNSTSSDHQYAMLSNDVWQVAGVTVYAAPMWTADMASSYFDFFSNEVSVPTWTDPGSGPNYLPPGALCDDGNGVTGIGIPASSSSLKVDPVAACERGSVPAICIDIYISQCSIGTLQGDCRNASPTAPASASRAQIIFPPTPGGVASLYIHESCFSFGTTCNKPLGEPYNHVEIAYMGSDTIAVTFHLTNSLTSLGGPVPTPSIDGRVTFVRGANGMFWPVTGSRDNFPSMSIIWQDQNTNTFLMQRDEGSVFSLINRFGWDDNWVLCVPQ